MHIGEKLKLVRKIRGLTQEALGEKVNKTRSLISHIEKKGKIHRNTLLDFLKALDISEQDLDDISDTRQMILREPSVKAYKSERKELAARIEALERENQMLRESNESLRRLVELLEEKTKKRKA